MAICRASLDGLAEDARGAFQVVRHDGVSLQSLELSKARAPGLASPVLCLRRPAACRRPAAAGTLLPVVRRRGVANAIFSVSEVLVGDPRPVGADDLVVAMPARIAINKAIELAIQFVAALSRERTALEHAPDGLGLNRRQFGSTSSVVLLLPQGEDLDDNRPYFERLVSYAQQLQIKLTYGGRYRRPRSAISARRSRTLPLLWYLSRRRPGLLSS